MQTCAITNTHVLSVSGMFVAQLGHMKPISCAAKPQSSINRGLPIRTPQRKGSD